MNAIKRRVKSHAKSALQRYLGVTVTRGVPIQPTKHGDSTLRGLRNWSQEDVVIDAGANDGRTVLRINEMLNSPRFFAFEPVESTYQKLVERTSHLPNVKCFQHALGECTEKREIFVNEIDAMSSLSPSWGEAVRSEWVSVKTIDQMVQELGIDFVHYLKIDTEGHELAVLRGAKETLSASKVAILQTEVGFGQAGDPWESLENVKSFLAPFGYRLSGIFNQCHRKGKPPGDRPADEVQPSAARILAYCDAMFLRAD